MSNKEMINKLIDISKKADSSGKQAIFDLIAIIVIQENKKA